jgi:phosphatidylglycerol:prolipoprotein diacylglycerol transferase
MFSFLFWRALRSWGVADERIFDLTFYATIAAVVFARVGFVATHRELFADSALKIAAIWVVPGLSFLGGLVGAIATLVYLSRAYKVRLGLVLDALGLSLTFPLIVGKVGSLLDAAEIGRVTRVPWGVMYPGYEGLRHPVQLYEIVALLGIYVLMRVLRKRAAARKWPYGLLGVLFFLTFSAVLFALELAKESSVYWVVTANQLILIGFFAESVGALYVRGGGREAVRPFMRRAFGATGERIRSVYAAISKRNTRGDSSSS